MTITLKAFLESCGVGTILHIGAENGSGWCFTGTALQATDTMASWADREIISFYYHEGREEISRYCCKLEPGIAVIVEGYEKGRI